jgi:hypothetical protein
MIELEGKKYDSEKIRLDLVPPEAIEAIGEVLTFGAKKYGDNTWQKLPDFKPRYYAALMRHMLAWMRDEKADKESGLSHLKHAITNLAFLVWEESQNEV